jgi:type I restriction enzyme S subunit
MPKNWKTYKLSEVIQIIGGGTPKTSIPEFWNGSIPWLSVKDFQGEQKFVFQTEKTITEEGLKKSSTKILPKGAIIISARGTVGELAVLEKEMTFNQSCYGILPNDKTDNNYLYYLLKQKIRELQGLSYGSVFDTITTKTFDSLDVYLPPLPEQTQIANILSAIDDKIENNLAINKTLEDMAMALYKHWFVDFGPFQEGEFVDSELGLIPKGWEVKRLEELIEIKYGKDHKKLNDGNIPVYGSGGIMRYVDDSLYDKESILIPRKGTLSNLFYVTEAFWSVDTMFYSKIKNLIFGKYIFHLLKNLDLASMDVGSAVPSLTTSLLKRIEIIVPSILEVQKFDIEVSRFFTDIKLNTNENQTLTKLRDTLLPKLISGEVRLKEFREEIDAEMNSA